MIYIILCTLWELQYSDVNIIIIDDMIIIIVTVIVLTILASVRIIYTCMQLFSCRTSLFWQALLRTLLEN